MWEGKEWFGTPEMEEDYQHGSEGTVSTCRVGICKPEKAAVLERGHERQDREGSGQ